MSMRMCVHSESHYYCPERGRNQHPVSPSFECCMCRSRRCVSCASSLERAHANVPWRRYEGRFDMW